VFQNSGRHLPPESAQQEMELDEYVNAQRAASNATNKDSRFKRFGSLKLNHTQIVKDKGFHNMLVKT